MQAPEKYALVMESFDAPDFVLDAENVTLHTVPLDFFMKPVKLAPRSECETDNTTLQLLPYMTLVHEDKVFVYARGGAGGESRLHGNLSIGIGGHVDRAPAEGETLLTLLRAEAAREYKEETGCDLEGILLFTDLIYDPTTEVGMVHLGLHCTVKHNPARTMKLEEGSVEHGMWLPREQLMRPETFDRLENWSKVVAWSLSRGD